MTVEYDLQSVKIPRLAGVSLKLFVQALENPLGRSLLLGSLMRSGGVEAFRLREFSEAPTPMPFWSKGHNLSGSAPDLNALSQAQTSMPGFAYASVTDYHRAYASGQSTPEETAEWIIGAIEASNTHTPALRAIIDCCAEDVRAQARASAVRWKAGRPLGPFDGVPVAIKDELDQAGYRTRMGTAFMGTSPVAADATPVARLRAAGALLIGKANMHEIGIGVTGHNPHHGTARNPHRLENHTGGSSSGPAAAVAAGLCPVAIGADGGGSIRIPAGLCGVVGLKATFGRISEHGAAPLCWSVAHVGPLAASARDAALAYAVIAGADPLDPNSMTQPGLSLDGFEDNDLSGLRIGVYRAWFNHATPEIVAACSTLLEKMTGRGAKIVEIEIPGLEATRVGHLITIASEMLASLNEAYRETPEKFSLEVRTNLGLAAAFSASDYVRAQRARTRAIAAFSSVLEKVDVIATPTTAITAPPIPADSLALGESDLSTLTEIMRYAVPANFTGLPAISMPAGYDTAGLPIGLQLMGPAWSEALLLRLANTAGQMVEDRRPALLYQPTFRI